MTDDKGFSSVLVLRKTLETILPRQWERDPRVADIEFLANPGVYELAVGIDLKVIKTVIFLSRLSLCIKIVPTTHTLKKKFKYISGYLNRE